MNISRNSYIFIQEKAFENVVWYKAAIFLQRQCVNPISNISELNLCKIATHYLTE